MYTIRTERLGLRNWRPSDFDLFAKMNADKEVMEFFPKTLSEDESIVSAKRFMEHFDKYGFCYFAAETLADQQFIGFIGLMHQPMKAPLPPVWILVGDFGNLLGEKDMQRKEPRRVWILRITKLIYQKYILLLRN